MQNAFSSSGGFCAGSVEVVAHQRINSPTYVFSAALPPLLAVSASEAISLLSTPLTSTDPAHPLSTLPTNVRALRQILDQVGTIEIPSAEMSPLIHFHIKPSVLEAKSSSNEGGINGRTGRQRSHSAVSHPQPSPIVVPAAGMSSATSIRNHNNNKSGGGGQNDDSTSVESSRQEQERLLQEIVDMCGENGVLLTTTKRTWAQEMTEIRPSIRICVSAALTKKEMEKAGNVVKNSINKVLGKKK
jgi:serine palmitoyltransferase